MVNEAQQPPGRFRRLWFGLGVLCLGLALAGVVLPVMPGVVFALIAAWAFARSSPRLEARLLDDPRFGPAIRDWRTHGAISRRGKVMAVLGMLAGLGVTALVGAPPAAVIAVAAIVAASALYILTRPAPPERSE